MSSQAQTATPSAHLDLSLVQPADIILTTSNAFTSTAIRHTTCGSYSHAILALQNGNCMQAVPETGVGEAQLSIALDGVSHAILYRHKAITLEYAAWVCYFAQAQNNKDYDMYGAVRSAVSSGCGITKHTSLGWMIEVIHESTQKRQHNNKFFCSELVASAFEKSGIPLLDLPPHAVSPHAIVTSKKLTLIKELIAT